MVFFQVIDNRERPSERTQTFSLIRDNWDDYHFKTLYMLYYTDDSGRVQQIGSVKIGEFYLGDEGGRPTIPTSFEKLTHSNFSVGQDREYYERLRSLGHELNAQVLIALNDIAFDEVIFREAIREPVTQKSLFRSVAQEAVEEQFRRIARGGVALTEYRFSYEYPNKNENASPTLDFLVTPNSKPPTNVHVVIGSNGTGKTTLLKNMRNALLMSDSKYGTFNGSRRRQNDFPFANLVTVTFSAFDPFDVAEDIGQSALYSLKHSYVGLKSESEEGALKNLDELGTDFYESVELCAYGDRRNRWLEAMSILELDPLLADSGVSDLLSRHADVPPEDEVISVFRSLSSGHKIAVLTMTKLVAKVEEQSLVLMDEPEAHLHPPLLSSLTRALSNLLEDRNGVAIVTTHSPVVLQEAPSECVYRISRSGGIVKADRLRMECFGEDVGILTSEVFGLEVTRTGFHQMLMETLNETEGSYDRALEVFNGKLGGEARAILRSHSTSYEAP